MDDGWRREKNGDDNRGGVEKSFFVSDWYDRLFFVVAISEAGTEILGYYYFSRLGFFGGSGKERQK